ncbi:MAG TPA: HD domain-containing phosphohydrolase [Thermoanaerobaculia bacterium]|nr:HD domain-containing phosphohydrolase [Thermoanaerobaculia bacterium]
MQAEVEELRPKLKEILYDCAVDIRATKAALYLFDGSSRFELVIEYGFRGTVRSSADFNDALVDRCGRGRTAFFVNGVGAEPRLSELLYASATDRLLAAPLYSRGKLIGFIDMRDKAGKAPFEPADVPKAQHIADRLVEVLADKPIFGHRFIALSKLSGAHATPVPEATTGGAGGASPPSRVPPQRPDTANLQTPAPLHAPAGEAPVAPQAPPPVQPEPARPSLASLIIDARNAASRVAAALPESLTETELTAARDVLRSILLIPGTAAATFSAYGHLGGVQEISARSTLTEEAKNLLQSKLNVWLTKKGEAGGYIQTAVLTPFGTSAPPIGAAEIQKVFTAPLTVLTLKGLYLTVAFSATPDRVAHELLGVMHGHLQLVLEQSLQRGALASLRARAAEQLVEPALTKYPALRRHSALVAKLCESFARHLGLPPAEVENARIVALVHDVGLRLLDYDRLYRKHDLTQEELGFLREHPSVGAALVEPLLGAEIARAVLCHHERVDGSGYPNNLSGDEIPLLSRIVQLCDAWVAITDSGSYQPAESPEAARAAITRGAGSQFDADLAAKFLTAMR